MKLKLTAALALALALILPLCSCGEKPEAGEWYEELNYEDISLKELYSDYFMVGTIYTEKITSGEDNELVLKQFNSITPENLMKPENMQPSEGSFTYEEADKMVAFAEENGLTVIGHTLAWHQQSGNWLGKNVDRETAIAQLKAHIFGVAARYDGKIFSWDVVNEAVEDGTSISAGRTWQDCLRKSQWYDSIGPDYIALAFQFAHEAAPNAKLYYNDYNLNLNSKATVVYEMVKDLKAQGVPIDGIGMQGHYDLTLKTKLVEKSIELFSSIEGIEIAVTELDIGMSNVQASESAYRNAQKAQARLYAELFEIYKAHSDRIVRVTFWGYRDDTSWRKENLPLLFDSTLKPKMSFYAVAYPERWLEEAAK